MSSTTLHAGAAPRERTPQGNGVGVTLAARVRGLARRLLRVGTRRARSAAEEAAAVREMARRIQSSEPGFASDLLAAADRHERLADGAR